MLLEQTVNTGIDVYTHSEMLPAHYYPAFKKYEHFKGNYGNAWWKQKKALEELGKIADINVEEYGLEMLKAGTDLGDFSSLSLPMSSLLHPSAAVFVWRFFSSIAV